MPIFVLTFWVFVIAGDILSAISINTFGADVSSHTPLVLSDLSQWTHLELICLVCKYQNDIQVDFEYLLLLAISLDNPMDNVSVYFSEYEWCVIFDVQVSLLDGSYRTRTAPIFTCAANQAQSEWLNFVWWTADRSCCILGIKVGTLPQMFKGDKVSNVTTLETRAMKQIHVSTSTCWPCSIISV